MSSLLDVAQSAPVVALVVAGALLALLAWLGWRRPTWLFLLALGSLAIRPQLLWGGSEVGYEWGLHQTLLVFALAANALHFGLRRTVNWPILALLASFGLSLAFGDLHPKLTLPFMLMSLALLALPFAFTQVVLEPGSRRGYALVIMLTPLLSVALGGMLQAAGLREVFSYEQWVESWYRLEGATGNASVFGMLAFAGFAIALHEWTRPGRGYAIYLAILNLALVILSGTRMAIFASAVFVGVYGTLSAVLRLQLQQQRWTALTGFALVAAILVVYWPTLIGHMFADDGKTVDLTGRNELWSFYWQEFLFSPWFGRGHSAGFVAAEHWQHFVLPTPHNEYLHLLVIGGGIGFVLIVGGTGLWFRQLLQVASPNDRGFLLALLPALVTYALTDNVLAYATALALYTYLGVVLTLPSAFALPVLEWMGAAEPSTPADPVVRTHGDRGLGHIAF